MEHIAQQVKDIINDEDMDAAIIAILEHSASARAKPAEVLELYFRAHPFMGKYQVIYDTSTQKLELYNRANGTRIIFDEYSEMQDFFTALSNVGRKDRYVRLVLRPDLNESQRKAKKDLLEEVSEREWFAKSHDFAGGFHD